MGDRGDERDGLVLFAGDVFNPSVESAITRGSHMVPILRELKLDASCVGESRAIEYMLKLCFFSDTI
jgi:2',3'-cyclic-nucleotide 2'-phosphodiesterase (5'-nucleotidase family)